MLRSQTFNETKPSRECNISNDGDPLGRLTPFFPCAEGIINSFSHAAFRPFVHPIPRSRSSTLERRFHGISLFLSLSFSPSLSKSYVLRPRRLSHMMLVSNARLRKLRELTRRSENRFISSTVLLPHTYRDIRAISTRRGNWIGRKSRPRIFRPRARSVYPLNILFVPQDGVSR